MPAPIIFVLTGSPAAGIDPRGLIDTRPLTRELYHYILNHRELYGLPRKFNIAFDGGGSLGVLEDTNDIGFAAITVGPDKPVPPGIYFRMLLGGITGHGVFARDCGVLLLPQEVVPAAVAIVRCFIDHGDRTDRKRARLHYLIERWGIERCLTEAAAHMPFAWRLAPLEICKPSSLSDWSLADRRMERRFALRQPATGCRTGWRLSRRFWHKPIALWLKRKRHILSCRAARANIRFMFQAMVTKLHSPRTLSSPRSRKGRQERGRGGPGLSHHCRRRQRRGGEARS